MSTGAAPHRVDAARCAGRRNRVDTNVTIGESPLAQLHMIVRPRPGESLESTAALDAALAPSCATGRTSCARTAGRTQRRGTGLRIAARYGRALPLATSRKSPAVAATDVEHLAALDGDEDLRLSLYRSATAACASSSIVDDIPLSDALPMMENMGLRVISEHPYRIDWRRRRRLDPGLRGQTAAGHRRRQPRRELRGGLRPDVARPGRERRLQPPHPRRQPVVAPGVVLRAYCKYLLQVGRAVLAELRGSWRATRILARLLVELFEARFDPATGHESKAEIKLGPSVPRSCGAGRRRRRGAGRDQAGRRRARGKREAQVEAVHDAIQGCSTA